MSSQTTAKQGGFRPLRQGIAYLLGTVLLIVALMALKGLAAWAAEEYVYSIVVVGGLLKSLELVEVSNVLIFALLGVGLGAMTRWLVRPWFRWLRWLILAIAVPLVFLSSYGVRHELWVQEVTIDSGLLPEQAEQITERLLQESTGHEGLWGFFLYTVRTPLLPTELSTLQSLDDDDQWFRSELTRYSGVEPGLISLIFRLSGWGIRVFYMGLAAITAAIYFTKGNVWAETHRQQSQNRPGNRPGKQRP
ncbi:hypothetical protein [Leptolyngbya sp. PCC 6406]|uniref:hypothetical protein n=1 Tax=Leptolyngbya sp. PCC 6406 TaxID=1173264 RepID=UPI0002ACDE16|nr:hypothetical protein [Leptolyngbya sp. PCC 6406]